MPEDHPSFEDRRRTLRTIRAELTRMRAIAATGHMGMVSYYLDLADAELADIDEERPTELPPDNG